MVPPILAHWGCTQADMDKLVEMVRTTRGSTASGPPTEEEESLIVMALAADRLRQAGYRVELRWEPQNQQRGSVNGSTLDCGSGSPGSSPGPLI